MKTSSKLFLRWSTQIFSYNFKILHRKGSIHLNADVLSRESQLLDNPTKQDAEETHIHKIFPTIKTCKLDVCGICSISWITSCRKLNPKKFDTLQTVSLNQLHALSHVNENIIYPFSSERLAYEQAHDRVLSEVKTWLQSDGPDYTNHLTWSSCTMWSYLVNYL